MDANLHAPARGRAGRTNGRVPSAEPFAVAEPADLHRRGIEFLRQHEVAEAIACLQEAARLGPDCAVTFNDLGHAFRLKGLHETALAHYRRALRLRPDVLELHANVAAMLQACGLLPAMSLYAQQAASLPARSPATVFELGTTLLRMRLVEEAEACFRFVLPLLPDHFDSWNNLGTALWEQGRNDEAEASYRSALQVSPDNADALTNLGNALWQSGRAEEAESLYRRALALRPETPETQMNLGIVLSGRGEQDEAIVCFQRALRLQPDSPALHDCLGTALARQGKPDEALAAHEHALQLQPNYAEAHRNRAMLWLARGDYERGWPEYEWRWACRGKTPTRFRQPPWQGEPLDGRTIVLHCEQGHGDTLQFIRYTRLVKERGATVIVICPPPLVRLLRRCEGIDQVLTPSSELPEFDHHAPLLSLPAIFNTTLGTIPNEVPYLFADPDRTERWRGQLSGGVGLTIGIAWQGNPRYGMDRLRSFPLVKAAPLARVEGVRLISLQRGIGTEQIAQLDDQFPVEQPGGSEGEALGDFHDTAALLKSLDLVVTPDMVYAHLAGGLGVRTWVVLPSVAEWRWLADREVSPWYPSARLFRQTRAGDWDTVFQRLAEAVTCLRRGDTPREALAPG